MIDRWNLFIRDLLILSNDLNFNPPLTLTETLTFFIDDISNEEIYKPLLFKTRILTIFFTALVEQWSLFIKDLVATNNYFNSKALMRSAKNTANEEPETTKPKIEQSARIKPQKCLLKLTLRFICLEGGGSVHYHSIITELGSRHNHLY